MVGHGLAEGGLNQAPAHIGRARAARRAALPVRGGRPRRRDRERHAGLLRRGRRALPRIGRAADGDPARRVGLRRHRRLRLHRRRDDRDRPPPDGRPRRGGRAWRSSRASTPSCRGPSPSARRSTAALERRPGRGGGPRRHGRAGAAHEVPPRPLRPAVRRRPGRGDARRPRRGRGTGRQRRSPERVAGPRQERRAAAARRRIAGASRSSGPIADSARDLLGDYSHLVHMETLREMRNGGERPRHRRRRRRHRAGRRARRPADDPRRAPLGARRRAEVRYARGTGISDGTDEELAAAVAAARDRRCRDRRARRAVRPDRRLDDRRVPRPLGPRVPRPPAGAARGGRRDRDAGRAGRRQRPAAGHRMGCRALRARSSSPGCPAMPARTRSRTC